MQIQNPPPHLIDWAFIAALLTTAVAIGTKWLLPALQKIAGGGSHDDAESAVWRGRVGAQLDQQDKRLDALLEATETSERLLNEIVRRGEGQEAAIRIVNTMAPKVDAILAITRKRQAKRKI